MQKNTTKLFVSLRAKTKCEGFITEDDLLFKTKRRKKGLTSVHEEERYRVVTVDEKVRLLDTVHKDPAGGHFGVHKTQEKVAERYYWKGMASDIASYCSNCLVCQRQNKMPKKLQNCILLVSQTMHLLNGEWTWLMQFSTFYMELPLMRDMEATEQTSLPGMFCTQS
ncbi:hypothetical protein EMCRGX_G028963 [Ephydatia muelleri]